LWQSVRGIMAYSGADGVSYVAASTLSVLAGVDNLDVEVWVLVEDLLDTTVVAALIVVVIMVVVVVLLVVVEGLVVVGRLWSVIVGCGRLRTTRA
jgi:hypothetical protein